jgi:alpha-tubulin suppressor-like RCC1 family protein
MNLTKCFSSIARFSVLIGEFVEGLEQVFVWGCNTSGQLGLGDLQNRFTPCPLEVPGDLVSFSCGIHHATAVIKEDPTTIFVWGSKGQGELGLPDVQSEAEQGTLNPNKFQTTIASIKLPGGEKIAKVVCGALFSVALTEEGK